MKGCEVISKRLENQLGVELFERDGRGMKPNAKGQDFFSPRQAYPGVVAPGAG